MCQATIFSQSIYVEAVGMEHRCLLATCLACSVVMTELILLKPAHMKAIPGQKN